MPWLIGLVVLAAVTLIGHGLWALLAMICRALFFDLAPRAIHCRHCGRAGRIRDGRCQWCGRLQAAAEYDEQSDLAAVSRQLRRWQLRGTVKPRTVERLLARLEAYRQSLSGPPITPKKATAPGPIMAEVIEPVRRPVAPIAPPAAAPTPRPAVPATAVSLPVPAPAPPKPRRSLAETLATFMEERNIRWGELAGGLLIVCSSVALVINLWEQLEAIPYFQFFIFVAVSAAMFGIGLYTEHRWKLASTSRGVLIIATLLVPLNFVAMVATRKPGFDPLALLTELTALGVFVGLVYRAGRVLVPQWAWWLTLAVVGDSGMLLLLLDRPSPLWALGVGAIATALEAVAVGAALVSVRRVKEWTADVVGRLFILTGIAAFALVVTLSMTAVRSDDHWLAVHGLSPLAAMAGLPVLMCGLMVMTGLTACDDQAGLRTAGTAVALVGATVMLTALGLAWPMPVSLLAVGLFNFVSLAWIARRYRLRPLHVVAGTCLAVAYVMACHVVTGGVSLTSTDSLALARLCFDGQTGVWLVGLFAIFAALSELLTRRTRAGDAAYYWLACVATVAVSVSLVTWPVLTGGGDHALRAAVVYAAYGVAGLAINVRLRQPLLEYLAAAILYAAALFGATAWLMEQPWVGHDPVQLVARPSLQCYAAAWAALSLGRVVLRLATRKWLPTAFGTLVGQPVDRTILRLLAAASLALATWQALPGVMTEYAGTAHPTAAWAFDTALGWSLLVITAVGVVAALWDEWRDDDVAAAVLLSVNAAALAAVGLSPASATASELRWGLALVFGISAVLVWFRSTLARACLYVGCRLQTSGAAPSVARHLWLATTVLPVVIGSAVAAMMRIAGQPPAGPLAGTWFAKLGMEVSHLLPLAVVVLGLVAYAVREASPGYAFVAGLIANLTVGGGYALVLARFGEAEAVRLVQLSATTAALWGLGWLTVRRFVVARSGKQASKLARPLLRLQVAESALGNLLLVLGAAAVLFFASPSLGTELHDFVAEVGSRLGWLTLAVASAAGIYRVRHFGERLRPELTGLVGLAALALAAATIEWAVPGTPWAYRALMLGWAMYALSVAAATWWAAEVYAPEGADGPPLALVRAAALWVRVAGLLAVTLGLKTVAVEGIGNVETLWAAGAIGIASAACAAMAVWLRREGWAFTAGLGVNLAASLAVCHRFALEHRPLGDEGVALWQANVIAGAVVALIWLAAQRRMYFGRRFSPAASPLLSVQVGCVAAAAMGLILVPALLILCLPDGETLLARQCTTSAAWFAWLLASGAAAVYLFHAMRRTVDVLPVFLLGSGALAAATRLPIDPAVAYQALTTAWLAAGLLLLVAGWLARRWLVAANETAESVGDWLRSALSQRELEPWVAAIPLLLAGVALRGTLFDPQWGDALGARVLAASILPGALAIWLRQPRHLYGAGLLANVAASLFWYAQAEPLWIGLLLANALAAAAASLVWSLWTSAFGPIGVPDDRDSLPPFEHAALALATGLLTLVAGWSWLAASFAASLSPGQHLTWLTVVAVIASGIVALWDKRTAMARPALYATGAAAVALALAATGWQGDKLAWATAPVLAGWLLVAALVRSFSLPETMRAQLRLPPATASMAWFSPTQVCFIVSAAALGIWTCLYFDLPRERLAGPATSALLLAASFAMVYRENEFWSSCWEIGALAFVTLLPAELGWTWLVTDEDPAIVWIHREVILLVSIMAVVACCEIIATRWSFAVANWSAAVRRFLPLAIGTTIVLVVTVLAQEIAAMPQANSDGTRSGVAMALAAKLAMVAVLAGLIGLALRYALDGQRDPLRLTPRGRQAYVYAAEVLGLAICLHFRITLPKLIPFGIIENCWTLVVMIVAFVGVGLSELFKRRGLEILSQPLRRTAMIAPLVPVLALGLALVWHPSGAREILFRAEMVSDEAVFFLVALFYGVEAWLRRSLAWAGLSAVAGNAGFWLLWHRLHFDFLVHPQLWLIPPALAVLVAEYVNHARLTRQQSDAIRYLALSVIYVSSTADVFISHVGREISLPLVLVLMGLSVIGMFSGMLLQVRSFLYLGFTFLLVDLSIMVYHAAWDLGHTWVFWASGIAVGAAILALFAVFEKRRNEAATQVGSGKPTGTGFPTDVAITKRLNRKRH